MFNRPLTFLLVLVMMAGVCMIGMGTGVLLIPRIPELVSMLTVPEPQYPQPVLTSAPTPTLKPTVIAVPTIAPTPTGPVAPVIEAAPTPVIIDPERRLIELYRKANPAVVNITTQIIRRDFFYGEVPDSGSGSGFVWDERGHIITNYHVIQSARRIAVSFGEDLVLPAEVIGTDPPNDLAVIKVEELPPGIQPLPPGDSDTLQVGQVAVAIGNPFGQFQRTLTAGVISALNRTIELDEDRVLRGVIQTDADINRGNSGGPLLDSSGEVIGITTAIYSPTGTNAGVGLAIPINKAKRVVPELIEHGQYLHAWLGLERLGYVITPRLAQALELPVEEGLLIARIYRDSPAHRANLRPSTHDVLFANRMVHVGGDILIAIDGIKLTSWETLDAYLQENVVVGQTVSLEVLRDNEVLQIEVEVGAEPTN